MSTTEELAIKIEGVDSRGRSNTHRLNKLEERQDDLDKIVASISTLANEQDHIKNDVTEIKSDVKTLAEKPGKHWENLTRTALAALVCGLLGFVLAQIGIK